MGHTKKQQQKAFETLKEQFAYTSPMAAPALEKVVVAVGTGSLPDKNKVEIIEDRLAKITGQKPAPRPAKKSIASFKTRIGQIIGYQVTLRGARMYDFLDRFLHVALPRSRDFQGVKPSALDEMGNLTIGVKEHTIFPETSDEELKDIFGLSVTIVTSARDREEALAFLETVGVPFRATDTKGGK
ncbi:50S ribosomal protein L5 [Candidatus Wolfebacteria bacterium]|nr:50S ribosomal protein L5 [Candidatus Wolfebacteria bacterium]